MLLSGERNPYRVSKKLLQLKSSQLVDRFFKQRINVTFIFRYNDGVRFPAIKIKTYSLYRKLPFPKKQSPQTVMIHEDIQVRIGFVLNKL